MIVDNVTIGDLTSTGNVCDGIAVRRDRNKVNNNKLIGTITGSGDGSIGIEIDGENNQVSGNIISGTITSSGDSSTGLFIEGENNQISGNLISGNIGSEFLNFSSGISVGGANEIFDNTVTASMQAATLIVAISIGGNSSQILRNNITLDFVQNAVVTSPTGTKAGVFILGNGTTPPTFGINNLISQNSIYGNSDVPGILLTDQANFNQAAPTINTVTVCGQNVTVEGSLFTRLGSDYTVELFSNDQRSQPNQGIHYIGSITISGNAGQTVQFNEQFSSTNIFTGNEFITATATDINNNTSEFSARVDSSNNTPIADDLTFSICSGKTFNGQLTGSNTGTNPEFNLSGPGPTQGSLTLNSDGSFSYTADSGASGADQFEFTITNGTCESDPATVVIDINSSPVIPSGQSGTVCSTAMLEGQLTATGGSGDYTFNIVQSPDDAETFNLNSDGSFVYISQEVESVTQDSFIFTATDSSGCASNLGTFNITINPVPTAESGEARGCNTAGNTITGTLTGSGGTGNLNFNISSQSTNGNVTLSGPNNSNFTYTLNSRFTGEDSFTFTATDVNNCTSEPATVNITVVECNGSTESLSIGVRELSGNRVIVFGTEEGLDNQDVSLFQNGELIQTVHINSPFSFIVGPLQPGEYVYQVKAFEDNGNVISSNIVNITITSPIPPVPPIPPTDLLSPIAKAIRNKYCPLVSPNSVNINGLLQNLT